MSEVRDMIAKALDGEPPLRLDFHAVRAGGRRRLARRHASIAAAAALGVVAVVSTAVTVGHLGAIPSNDPASTSAPVTPPTEPSVDCADLPVPPGAVGPAPPVAMSGEQAIQAARLNAVFSQPALPLPAGVSAEPARPPLCPNDGGGWVTRFTLRGPAGDRGVFISVQSWASVAFSDCSGYLAPAVCKTMRLDDGTEIRIVETPPAKPTDPVRVEVGAWRADGAGIALLETGASGPNPAPRILDDAALAGIVDRPVGMPPLDAPSRDVTTRLTDLLAQEWALPVGIRPEPVPGATTPPMTFGPVRGTYVLAADLVDAAGTGNLFIELKPRRPGPFTPACAQATCELFRLPDGRTAALSTQGNGVVIQYVLSTMAPSGAELQIISRNKSAHTDRRPGSTRVQPPLSGTDLIKIATGPGAYW